MERVTKQRIGNWAGRVAALSSGHLARERAKQTLRDAVEAALPAPHRNMIRRGYADHIHREHYRVGPVGVTHYSGADPQKLADDVQLRAKLRRQYPRKMQLQDTTALRRMVTARLANYRTTAALLAAHPELAPVISDGWYAADNTKLRRALRKAGWPIP